MKITLKKNVFGFFVIILLLVGFIMPKGGFRISSFAVIVTTSAIGVIGIWQLVKAFKLYAFSLDIMHWLFVVFFYFVSPVVQRTAGIRLWGFELSEEQVLRTNAYILLWIMCYLFGRKFAEKYKLKIGNTEKNEKQLVISKKIVVGTTILSLSCLILLMVAYGFTGLTAREGAANAEVITSKMSGLILSRIPRTIIVFSVVVSILYKVQQNKNFPWMLNIVILLIAAFPTALSRNLAATIYGGLFVVLCYYSDIFAKKDKPYFIYGFIVGFLIVFPLLSEFRRTDVFGVDIKTAIANITDDIGSNFESADYDAFSIIVHIKNYVDTHGLTLGKQLLSSILFFVPRSIWAGKSYGSGQVVFESIHESFTNVSCPIIAEGYINFGIFGIIIFALIFGFFSKRIDIRFWNCVQEQGFILKSIVLIYPFLLPSYFFMLRGDLMSSLAYMMSFVIPITVLCELSKKKVL